MNDAAAQLLHKLQEGAMNRSNPLHDKWKEILRAAKKKGKDIELVLFGGGRVLGRVHDVEELIVVIDEGITKRWCIAYDVIVALGAAPPEDL